MRILSDIKVGDYIYCEFRDKIIEPYLVLEIVKFNEVTMFKARRFGVADMGCWFEIKHEDLTLRTVTVGDIIVHSNAVAGKGTGTKYIHNKTHREYTLVSNKFMFKDNVRSFNNDVQEVIVKAELEWRNDLVLYKAEYENQDGPFFARTQQDFNKNFTLIY